MTQTMLATLHKRTPAHYRIMPWPNGKGSTTELLVFPKGSSLGDASATWRVSMAAVPESGPFSRLPAYQRIITVVKGAGFRLRGDMGTDTTVTPGNTFDFSGAEEIFCEVMKGACIDLNVIYKRTQVKAELQLCENPHYSIHTEEGLTLIMVCLEGSIALKAYGKRKTILKANESAYFHQKTGQDSLALDLLPSSRLALIWIMPL